MFLCFQTELTVGWGNCCSNGVMELARGVRAQLEGLISGLADTDLTPMSLGLSHSLSRYKLKFSPDKVGAAAASLCVSARATQLLLASKFA